MLPDFVCIFFLVLPQGYVDGLVEYETTCGARLGVEVITTFRGDRCSSYEGPNSKDGDDPTWLKLKWGVAIASPADVLRPGGSMGLLACMVGETYSPEYGRRPEVSTHTCY